MLILPPSVRVFVATEPVDGRKGPDSLMMMVRDVFRLDIFSGHLFVFFSKRRDRVRTVYWDRDGIAMWTKKLDLGKFELPKATRVGDQHIVVGDAIFDVIFKGVRMAPKQRKRRLH